MKKVIGTLKPCFQASFATTPVPVKLQKSLSLEITLILLSFFTQGIVTQETGGRMVQFGSQYLVAVYVKFLESAGARAAPFL